MEESTPLPFLSFDKKQNYYTARKHKLIDFLVGFITSIIVTLIITSILTKIYGVGGVIWLLLGLWYLPIEAILIILLSVYAFTHGRKGLGFGLLSFIGVFVVLIFAFISLFIIAMGGG